MLGLPTDLSRRFDAVLESNGIAPGYRRFYRKWLRYYLDFCHKYDFNPLDPKSFSPFNDKLQEKDQPLSLRKQAYHAVCLYHKMDSAVNGGAIRDVSRQRGKRKDGGSGTGPVQAYQDENGTTKANRTFGGDSQGEERKIHNTIAHRPAMPARQSQRGEAHPADRQKAPQNDRIPASGRSPQQDLAKPRLRLSGASWEWVFEKLESAIKVRHYSPKTLKAYRTWTQKLQTFVKSKEASLLDMDDVRGFLSYLAVEKRVSASSQNQAFNALLFLFRHVLERPFEKIEGVVRAKR